MLKNDDIVEAFENHKRAENRNMLSTGSRLFSYCTCVAEWDNNGVLYINTTKYSRTTSRHTDYVRNVMAKKYKHILLENVPINRVNLIRYYNECKKS